MNNQTPLLLDTLHGGGEVEAAPTLLGGSRRNGGYSHDDVPLVAAFPITNVALRGSGSAATPSPDATGRVRLRDPGLGVGEDGDPAGTITVGGPGAVAVVGEFAFKPSHYTRGKDGAPTEVFPPLSADADKGDQDPVVLAYNLSPGAGSDGAPSAVETDVANALTTVGEADKNGRGTHIVAFTCKDAGGDAAEDVAPTLRAMNFSDSHANGGGQVAVAYAMQAGVVRQNVASGPDGAGFKEDVAYTLEARPEVQIVADVVTFALRGREDGAVPEVEGDGQTVGTLRAASGGSSRDYVAFAQNQRDEVSVMDIAGALAAEPGMKQQTYVMEAPVDVAAFTVSQQSGGFAWERDAYPTLDSSVQSTGNQMSAVRIAAAVRRLTPMECERLQGYRDGYTLIAWRGRPPEECPDGPRYRALGNSWAVPCVAWIGRRIVMEIKRLGDAGMAPGLLWAANGPTEYRMAA